MTSLMDEKYLAHLDMWIYLTLNPECGKGDYLKLDRPFARPVHDGQCHACDVAVVCDIPDCDSCPLEFEEPCAHYSDWTDLAPNLWGYYSLVHDRHSTDKTRYYASEILMTRWRRK